MSVLDRPRDATAPLPPGQPAGRGRHRLRLWVAAVLVLVLGGWLLAPYAVRVAPPGVALDADAGLMVEGYGPAGTFALDYRFGEQVLVTVPIANDSPVPLRVESVELVEPAYPLMEPVPDGAVVEPFTLLPGQSGEVDLTFEFTNCRYYHERANNAYEQVRVAGSVLGRPVTRTVDLAVPLVVHSQVILNCPDRTLVRGDDRRV
ncbi:MAG: hypothetical protein ACPF9W_06075 [Nocardioides sp.]